MSIAFLLCALLTVVTVQAQIPDDSQAYVPRRLEELLSNETGDEHVHKEVCSEFSAIIAEMQEDLEYLASWPCFLSSAARLSPILAIYGLLAWKGDIGSRPWLTGAGFLFIAVTAMYVCETFENLFERRPQLRASIQKRISENLAHYYKYCTE